MSTRKDSSFFLQGNEKFKQLVNDWQTKLGTVEAVLGCWGDVQKKWQALESIFIGSADIRVQLPEDSKRFDAINADFQDLMRSAPDVTGVVEACNLEGRDERLNNLLSQLEMCEKALQVWLLQSKCAHSFELIASYAQQPRKFVLSLLQYHPLCIPCLQNVITACFEAEIE